MLRKLSIFLFMVSLLVHSVVKADITLINNFNNFNKIITENKVLVKFFATWCGPCRASRSTIEEFSADNKYKDIKFIEVNVDGKKDDGYKIANKCKIRSIPVFMFINHAKVIARIEGFDENAPTRLKQELDNLLNSN